MENKKGSFANPRTSPASEPIVNESIPKHAHQHNTPPQHLRLLQYGLKIPNHQHTQINPSSHQHQPSPITPQPHLHHHRSQSPYQKHETNTPNIIQNQLFHQIHAHQYPQKQENQQGHYHYQTTNPSPYAHQHNVNQLHQQNAQIWVPHQPPTHYHPQQQQQAQKSEPQTPIQSSSPTSPQSKQKHLERKKVLGGATQSNRFPSVKRPTEAPVTIQGWLHKQGSEGLMLWKKRWFVLSEYCLFYYKGPGEEKLLGSILLPSYKVSICGPEDKVNRKYAFKCEHANMRTYLLAADTQELMMQWVRVLNMASLLQNTNDTEAHSQPSIPSQPTETTIIKQQVPNLRNTPTHIHSSSNTTDLSNPSQQELNQYSQPLYANAPPKPRRLTDGYSSPSLELLDRFSGETTKYVGVQKGQQYNVQPIYMTLSNSSSKSPINLYGNPQLHPEYISRTIQHQMYNKHLHIPDHAAVHLRENHNVERRTPDTYGRSKLNQTKSIHVSDYEDIYTDQSMYKRPLSPIAYTTTNNNRLNPSLSVPAVRPYTPINIHGPKTNLPYVPHQQLQQKVPNTIPRPHSADFLEYEVKYDNQNPIARRARPKSSLDINRHATNDNYFYTEEGYAEKMRKSAQYLPKMANVTGPQNEYQKWHPTYNKNESEFPPHHSTSRPINFNEVNQDFCQRELQPVRSRSVLSDGSLCKEVDMAMDPGVREHYEKEPVSPAFHSRHEVFGHLDDMHRSRDYEQFTRSASARLAQSNGQIEEKLLNREGKRKREESMKRLLEWKQRMLQSPLNRKVNQSVGKPASDKCNVYYRTNENGYPSSNVDMYSENRNPAPQYNSYSSDDEENEDGSNENVQTQAGRTTDTYSTLSRPHISAPKASTTVLNSMYETDDRLEGSMHDAIIKRLPLVCLHSEKDNSASLPNLEMMEKPLKVETITPTHTAHVASLRVDSTDIYGKEIATVEVKNNGITVQNILGDFHQMKAEGTETVEENYMTMTPRKSVLEPSETSSILSMVLSTDADDNLYVEMTQGSDISLLKPGESLSDTNDNQPYETLCFNDGKAEPVYAELNQFDYRKPDLPDILMASQNKGTADKSDSSDADDEASKDLDSLDTLYNPRFSLSDSFRPASYYLGASQTAPELQDSSDSELVSPPPIPTSPPPMDDLDNMDETVSSSMAVSLSSQEGKDDLFHFKLTNSKTLEDVELRSTSDYERMLKRRPVSEEVYYELEPIDSKLPDSFDLDHYLRNLEVNNVPNETKLADIHNYENMFVQKQVLASSQNSSSIETLSPSTLHSHSRDNSRDTASSQITTSSRRSTFSPNDFILRAQPSSSTSIIDEVSGYLSSSSPYLTPVASESTPTLPEITSNSFYLFGNKSKPFISHSAPYYYSDLSINTSRTDSSSSILTLNNQRSSATGSKRDIMHIINPIRCNNHLRKTTYVQHPNVFDTRCKLAAEARSASVDFLNIADKSGNIDKKNIYESDTLKRLKAANMSVSLQQKSANVYFGSRSEKFNESNVRRSYSFEGLLENVLSQSVVVPQEFRDIAQQNDPIGCETTCETTEGSHLWEEDSLWREQLRSASQRHTRSLDDLDCIREFDKRPKKQTRGITRLVTYVNDNMFNMPFQDKRSIELEVKKEENSKNSIFIIDREKLRQWDFLSSAPSDAQSFAQSPSQGYTNTVVDLGAGVSAYEASEQNTVQNSASGSISITARDTFPRSVPTKKVWTPNLRPTQSKSITNLANKSYESEYGISHRPQQGTCYVPPVTSHPDISSDTSQSSNSRRANCQSGDKMNMSAGDLLGRTHEELVLLLIQLRRQSANNCKSIEACYNDIDNIQARLPQMDASKRLENLQKLEQIKQHLLELEKQYEKGKPLVNLVDNMVKLGSLYRFPKDNNNLPFMKDRLEFNQYIQERRLLAEERRDWNRLSPSQSELQTKVKQLYQLDRLIQEESETLQSLQHDKEEIERTLGGLRHRLIKGFKDPIEVEQARKQQIVLENELSRVHSMLAQNSRKLEETVAGNARLEQELLVLKQKLQLSKQQRSSPQISNAGDSLPCVIGTSAMLESDLHRVQQKVGDLQRQRQELSVQVRQLTDRSNSLQQLRISTNLPQQANQGNKKKVNLLWRETDLDTMKSFDHGESCDSSVTSNSITPLYINTNLKQNVESDFSTSSYKSNDSTSDENQNQNLFPQEKQEIKTVRIVKRESERRQRDREKVCTGKWDIVNEEEDSSQSSSTIFRPTSIQKTQSSATLERLDSDQSTSGVLSRQSSLSQPSLPQLPSDIRSPLNVSADKLSELSPIFKSESAKQIIMEMATQDTVKHSNRRIVPKEKRRHYTAPHNNLLMKSLNHLPTDNKDFDSLNIRRARDDLDMERALRQRIDAPDVVRSTLSNKELKYNESTIDNILGTPNKIIIPERYVPEQLPQLTAEEQQYRLRKVESIKKMLSDTTIISGSSPNLAAEETNSEHSSSSATNKTSKIIEEKKQREHLLQLNQILAKQVMEMSKIVAVKALATLPLESGQISSEEDLSPDVPLPIYQQRDNFYS
ncbi:uncharacterized protein LOC116177320 isoform X2 [Photinus pyralis]|nr:uncharacterized protein LOC116177320 isoform X2 [Photinus pyralis]